MKRTLVLLFAAALSAGAQSTVYLKSSTPASVWIDSVTWNGTTYSVNTAQPHGFSTGNIVALENVCTSGQVNSTVNGIRRVTVVDANDFTIQTLAGANIANSGSWANCGGGSLAYTSLLTAYTLGSGPFGPLDGVNGPYFRRLALSTSTGNVAQGLVGPTGGIVVSGQSGSPLSGGIITVTTSYPHGVQVTSPQGQQEYISFWGTTSQLINTNGTYSATYGNAGLPGAAYPVVSAATYTIVVNAPPGVANGDYTTNPTCGSNGSTYDTINGSANCTVVSQLAYTASYNIASATYTSGIAATGSTGQTCIVGVRNYWGGGEMWGTVALTGTNTIASGTPITITYPGYNFQVAGGPGYGGDVNSGSASCSNSSLSVNITVGGTATNKAWDAVWQYAANNTYYMDPILYRSAFEGGQSGYGFWGAYQSAAVYFLVNQQSQQLLNVIIYSLDYLERGYGVNFTDNELIGGDGFSSQGFLVSWNLLAAWPYLSPTEKTVVLDKIYNDLSDPTNSTVCSTTDNHPTQVQIASNASGSFQSGTSGTSFQLQSPFPSISLANNVIGFNLNQASPSYGQIATYNTSTGAGTVSNWSNGPPSSGTSYAIFQTAVASSSNTTVQQTSGNLVSGGTASVTLASGSSGNYVDDEIFFPILNEKAFITAYNTGTRVATLATALAVAPSAGTYYSISNTVAVTGTNSTFNTTFSVGQGLTLYNLYGNGDQAGAALMVDYIASPTLMYVSANSGGTTTSTPTAVWLYPPWNTSTNNDCGWSWLAKHGYQDPGGQYTTYPPNGGTGGLFPGATGGNGPMLFSQYPRLAIDFAAASLQTTDQRPVTDLAEYESGLWDFWFAHYWNWEAGSTHSGNDYAFGDVAPGIWMNAWALTNAMTGSSPAFPSLNLTGNWTQAYSTFKEFMIYPDWPSKTTQETLGTPGPTLLNYSGIDYFYIPGLVGWLTDGSAFFQPDSTTAAYSRNLSTAIGTWDYNDAHQYDGIMLLTNLPTIGNSDYTVQPHQKIFGYGSSGTNSSLCTSLSGYQCNPNFGGFIMISREGHWNPDSTSHGARTDSHITFQARSYWNDYDCPMNGHLQIYKTGELLATDGNPDICYNPDYTTFGGMLQFGGSNANVLNGANNASVSVPGGYPPETPFTAWSSANHGSWDASYGDQNSQYMRVCANLAGAYNQNPAQFGGAYVTFGYANRCIDELKPTAGDHFLIQWDSVATSTAQSIATHLHYPQNGQSQGAFNAVYPEGNTTCPGTGGCASLNTNRWVQELESGTGDGIAGDPLPNYGLITNFLSPSNIYVSWDGSSFSGAAGGTDRVTVCAGSGSCNGSATSFESFIVHKVANGLTDTSLTTSAITTADGHWFGAQMYGAQSCAVIMEARDGANYGTISNFTPPSSTGVCAGNVQYLFGGLSPGTYAVAVSGIAVTGSPFTVSANDYSIEFTGGPGAVSITPGSSPPASAASTLSGQTTVSGAVIIH